MSKVCVSFFVTIVSNFTYLKLYMENNILKKTIDKNEK
jgi:hypothetical protein